MSFKDSMLGLKHTLSSLAQAQLKLVYNVKELILIEQLYVDVLNIQI